MRPHRRVPYSVKLLYSAFVAIVVPLYWVTYSPWNFLYFCDVALLVTAMAIWIESPLLVSTQAVAIVAMQTLWVIRRREKGRREKGTRTFFHVCVFVNSMTFLGRPRG
jgi:Flp pilus assembly protein TadB